MSEKKFTKEEANKILEAKLNEAKNIMKECQDIADEYGLMFGSPIEEYGMGGSYIGLNHTDEWTESNRGQWMPSSQSC